MGAPEDDKEPETLEDMENIVNELKEVYFTGKTRSLDYRLSQLKQLAAMLKALRNDYAAAVNKDMKKPEEEIFFTDIRFTDHEIGHTTRHLEEWMSPSKIKTDAAYAADDVHMYPEPRGVVMIFGAWNYPLQLTMIPLIGAIAAGCCAVIKPSELVPHSTAVIVKYFREFMDPDCYRILQGGPDIAMKLMEQRWDHVFFTGSSAIGKKVAAKAAANLISTTLELGGKSPTIVDDTANVDAAARRICWGKFLNSGQVCIAPDYVIVHKSKKEEFVASAKKYIEEFYGEDPSKSPDFSRIVNDRNFERVKSLLDGGKVIYGGQTNAKDRYIGPTILEVSFESNAMQEEIFGPIMPILEYEDFPTLVNTLRRREKPLVTYFFSTNKQNIDLVRKELSSGTLSVNDTITFVCIPQMPFGGVGFSGQGRYHGKASFDSFTNYKGVHCRNAGMEFSNNIRYPPYKSSKLKDILYTFVLYNSDDEFSGFKRTLSTALKYTLIAGLVGILAYNFNLQSFMPSLEGLDSIQKVKEFISSYTVTAKIDH